MADLQTELGGEDFEVVTLATGRNPAPSMTRFFESIGVDNLPLHRDPDQAIARGVRVLGLPTTVILDREGREIARLDQLGAEQDGAGLERRGVQAAPDAASVAVVRPPCRRWRACRTLLRHAQDAAWRYAQVDVVRR